MDRRRFLHLMGAGFLAGVLPHPSARSLERGPDYSLEPFGSVRLLHLTNLHGQILPNRYREASEHWLPCDSTPPLNLKGKPFLEYYGIAEASAAAHALTDLDFEAATRAWGKTGGIAHLARLTNQLRRNYPSGHSLLLDGGHSWFGSGPALWSEGQVMVELANRMGIDAMTGHWEFAWPAATVERNVRALEAPMLACNLTWTKTPLADPHQAYVFEPYLLRDFGDRRLAVVGFAFPYMHERYPRSLTPEWEFGLRPEALQRLVNHLRTDQGADGVILLSQAGLRLDLHLAKAVRGIDVILGGHSGPLLAKPLEVISAGHRTWVTAGGANGKFLGVMDLDLAPGRVADLRYRLLPVFSDYLEPLPEVAEAIQKLMAPYGERLAEPLAVTESLLSPAGAITSSWGRLAAQALREVNDTEIGFSKGYRFGTTLLPGDTITLGDLLDNFGTPFAHSYTNELNGFLLKMVLEEELDLATSLDIRRVSQEDLTRVAGLTYVCKPGASFSNRIDGMRLTTGDRPLRMNRSYSLSGWSWRHMPPEGPPVWEVLANYLRQRKSAPGQSPDQPPRWVPC